MQALSEIATGQTAECFVLLVDKEQRTTRDGKPFYRVVFRDRNRSAAAMIWNDSGFFEDCDTAWKKGDFYRIRCQFEETKYGPQIDLQEIRPVEDADKQDGFTPSDFFMATRFNTEAMYSELVNIAEENIADESLRELVIGILQDFEEDIKRFPAASRNHHAFLGGFLEHVLSVTKNGLFLGQKYAEQFPNMKPPLNVGLVVAGTILHDIGKMQELDGSPQGASYTAEGRLIGHILLGRDIVREKAASIEGLDRELVLRLEHIIVSHQNLPEWGSPIAPHSPEALLVHYADDVDAKYQMMADALSVPPKADEQFTPRDNPMRRSIFRGLPITKTEKELPNS